MAGFCRNCGSPLGEGQAFCVKCGTRVGDTSPPSAAPPVAPLPPPVAAAPPAAYVSQVPAAPPAASGTSALVKILIGVVIVFVAFGLFAAATVIYIGHRVHQKAQELGLTRSPEETRESRAELQRIDACALLSRADVAQAVKMEIVRTEVQTGDTPGCTYWVSGDAADLTAKHLNALHKNELSKSQQDMVENFGKTILHGATAAPSANNSDHPGEAPVLSYSIDGNAAQLQMRLNKATLGNMGPGITPAIPNLGDEAFDAAGAMLFVRKGDKVIRIMYMSCPCSLEDVLPLARKIVDSL